MKQFKWCISVLICCYVCSSSILLHASAMQVFSTNEISGCDHHQVSNDHHENHQTTVPKDTNTDCFEQCMGAYDHGVLAYTEYIELSASYSVFCSDASLQHHIYYPVAKAVVDPPPIGLYGDGGEIGMIKKLE